MKIPYEILIARRYLKAKRKQSFISLITILSVAGVAVGVMALVVVIAVMTGAELDFRERILGFQSHITVMRSGGKFTDYNYVADRVKKIPGVTEVAPYVSSQVLLRSAYGVSGASIRGISPDVSAKVIADKKDDRIKEKLKKPDNAGVNDVYVPPIILGKELARNMGVSEDDIIYLISPKGMISPVGPVPSMRKYRVTGVFESGMYEYDGFFAYLHIDDARKALRMGDAVSGLDVWINDANNVADIRELILNDVGVSYWARDWIQMNASLFAALKLEKYAMFVILILIVLVAAFNIASTLIMMVMEKTKDVAILRTMGATDRSIQKIFVYQGTVIGLIGTGIGTILGVVICYILKEWEFIKLPDVYAFAELPVQLELADVLTIAGSAVLICFLSTLYPAYQAAKIDPVEAIRYG